MDWGLHNQIGNRNSEEKGEYTQEKSTFASRIMFMTVDGSSMQQLLRVCQSHHTVVACKPRIYRETGRALKPNHSFLLHKQVIRISRDRPPLGFCPKVKLSKLARREEKLKQRRQRLFGKVSERIQEAYSGSKGWAGRSGLGPFS